MLLFGRRPNTHVQYTQTDTIRQTDGPMVLLVHMHLIKGTYALIIIMNIPLSISQAHKTSCLLH